MNVRKQAIHTEIIMKPRGGLYVLTVTALLPNAAVAAASISTTRGRTSDQDGIGGDISILQRFSLFGDGSRVMELKSMSER